VDIPPITDSERPSKRPVGTFTLKGSARALELSKDLAKYYGTSQADATEAALTLMNDHVVGIDVIQIPELMSTLADLEETIGRLIIQAEHLERLAYELAAFEADRT
jgi:hypothetical protein